MKVTVGITTVQDAFGVAYGHILAGPLLASLPVGLACRVFQRRVTQAITLSARRRRTATSTAGIPAASPRTAGPPCACRAAPTWRPNGATSSTASWR